MIVTMETRVNEVLISRFFSLDLGRYLTNPKLSPKTLNEAIKIDKEIIVVASPTSSVVNKRVLIIQKKNPMPVTMIVLAIK